MRRLSVGRLGAHLSTCAILHPQFRVHVVDNARVVSEDALSLRAFDRVGRTGRPTCTVLLAGSARISAFGEHRWLGAGAGLVVAHKQAICMRQEGPRYRAVVLEWEPGSIGDAPAPLLTGFTLDAAAARAVSVAADALHADPGSAARDVPDVRDVRDVRDVSNVPATIASLLATLRGAGVPVRACAPDELVHDVPPRMAEVAQALDEVLSLGSVRPTTVDLEERLGLSARQLNRLVEAFHVAYGFNSQGWRDTVNRRRILLGAALMTAEGATVVEVATAIGFSSAEAFARALGDAGLPPPSSIASEVERLGAAHAEGA